MTNPSVGPRGLDEKALSAALDAYTVAFEGKLMRHSAAIEAAIRDRGRIDGAYDVGCIVPLCRAAHTFYDEHRSAWPRVTGFTEKRMANEAGGYALRWIERGGKVNAA